MPTIAEAKQQLQQAQSQVSLIESQLEKQQKTLEQQQKEISSQHFPARTLTFQQKYLKGSRQLAGRVTQKKEIFQTKKRGALSDIFKAKQSIEKYRKGELARYKKEISDYEKQIKEAEVAKRKAEQDRAYRELAWKIAAGQVSGSYAKTMPLKYKKLIGEYSEEIGRREMAIEKAYKLEAEKRAKEQLQGYVGYNEAGEPIMSIAPPYFEVKEIQPPSVETKETFFDFFKGELFPSVSAYEPEPIIKAGTITAVKPPESFLGKLSSFFSKKESEISTQKFRGKGSVFGDIKGAFIGFAEVPLEALQFGKSLITHPITTTKKTGKGLYRAGEKIITGEGFPEIGKALRQRPSYTLGKVAGELALFKGVSYLPKIALKGTDILRTRGLKEIPKTDIIAPEYFKGERFPHIKKGQTAGELLKEFKSQGYGYTASSKPFKSETFTFRGTSELPGVYQAPKLSPHFLRINGEEIKTFTLNPFKETLKPSAIRITPKSFELTPFVKFQQKTLAPLKPTKEFFETAIKGKSYIPFIKTEKEAVIPFRTPLRRTGKIGYFKFEGRRVPIYEFEVSPVTKSKQGLSLFKKQELVEDIIKSYGSRRVGQTAKYSPLDILYLSSRGYTKTSYKGKYTKPSYIYGGTTIISSFRLSKSTKPSVIYGRPSKPRPSKRTPPSYIYGAPSIPKAPSSTYYKGSETSFFSYTPFIPITPTKEKKKKYRKFPLLKKPKRKIFQPTKYLPSFTALSFKITAKKKPKKILKGYAPTIRPIIIRKR